MNRIPFLVLFALAVICLPYDGFPQASRTIKGEILSEESSPIPGLAVIQLGTNNAVVTDLNGQFELVVDDEKVIYIHLFGLDLEIYLKYDGDESSKTVYLSDWKQIKKSNRKIFNEWTAKNHN